MAILPGYIDNFETLIRAARDGRLALVECTLKESGETCIVVAAISDVPDGPDSYDIVPVARLFDGNPYDILNPPDPTDAVPAEECDNCGHPASSHEPVTSAAGVMTHGVGPCDYDWTTEGFYGEERYHSCNCAAFVLIQPEVPA